MKLLNFITVLVLLNIASDSDHLIKYRILKESILNSEKFDDFKTSKKSKSAKVKFSKHESFICSYRNQLNYDQPKKRINKFCKDKSFIRKRIKGIEKLNDKGKKDFVITFSNSFKNIIVAEIAYISKNIYESRLVMVYEFDSHNKAKLLTSWIIEK